MSSNTQAPSKDAILRYVMKKKAEEEAAKERRFQEMLNPYKKFNKKGEPDEEFLKSQKKRERLLKKKEEAQRKLQQKADEERLKKQNEELIRLKKQQDELRAIEEGRRQAKIRKQAVSGKPVDKKMKEYLEKIKAQREAEKAGKSAADRKRDERRLLEERIYASSKSKTSQKPSQKPLQKPPQKPPQKPSQKPQIDIKDEKDREKRILENMRKQQTKSINSNPSRSQNDEYIPSKKSTVSSKPVTSCSSVTSSTLSSSLVSNKIPKKKPRVGEYSPTRPSIISKSHNGNRNGKVEEYVPTKVNSAKEQKGSHTKSRSDAESSKPTPQYIPSPKSKLAKSDNGILENGHKIKARSELFGGDQISRTSSNTNQPPKKKVRATDTKQSSTRDSTKIDRDALREKERLLKERELQAARELELQKARNKELEEQLAKERELARLRAERERDRERELARLKEIKKRRPVASNKILPPIGLTYRRSMNYQPVSYDDEEEEEDEDMRDFIDDGDDLEAQKSDVSHYIREIFGYDKRKYAMIDDDDIEEATFAQQMKEEMESAKAGLLEDLEDMRKEEEEKRRKAKLKKRRHMIDDSDED